ncbi:MAG: heavy metal sensor histidine kinase [Verrucomicrobiota bacterium]|nr:heavy metal sensor histidine kinase [Verrucomicrobiota bacterium]
MSSKNVKNAEPSAPLRAGRLSTGRSSIVTRLTVLYTLSAFGMLLLAAGFLHWTLMVNFHRQDAQFLADKVHLLRTILRKTPADTSDLKEEVEWETASLHFTKYYARVLDPRGRTMIETPGMNNDLPVAFFPAPTDTTPLEARVVSRKLAHNQRFLLLSATAELGEGHGQREIQVALDMSLEDAFLQHYRHDLAWAVLFGVLFSAVAGAFVARRGMRPLAELTRATDRISASQLHERVAGEGWPRELASLAKGFDRMLDRLEDSFRRLSQFSGDLAHELRTPINNLRGEAGVALSQSRTPEEYRRTLESSLEEYERLTRLIDNLLFLARADSPTTGIARARCDARRSIEAVREFYEALAADRGVNLWCEAQGTVDTDPVLFRQAVSNLLSNALNHTPRGGRVRVCAGPGPGGGLEVRVSDNGCGIAAEHLPHIFDRLYRADPARSHSDGAGLGLAIVKSIMALHGGSVRVHSEPGKGACFTLTFPSFEAPEEKAGHATCS